MAGFVVLSVYFDQESGAEEERKEGSRQLEGRYLYPNSHLN